MISDGSFRRPAAETYVYNRQTFSLYRDPLPLYVSDLLEIDDSRYSAQLTTTASPLLATHTTVHRPRLGKLDQADLFYKPDLSCTVTEVRFAPLYGFCRRALLEQATDRVLHGRWGSICPLSRRRRGFWRPIIFWTGCRFSTAGCCAMRITLSSCRRTGH